MPTPSPTDVVTAAVAVAALLLSLYNYFIERREKATRLIVLLSQGANQVDDDPPIPCLFVDIANPTLRRIVVTEAEVCFSRTDICLGAKTLAGDHQRAVLLPGDNEIFWLPLARATEALTDRVSGDSTPARARARDALGKYHYSKGRDAVRLM